MGVKICAPSIPPPPEPSSKLSRVTGQEACFSTLTSVIPYFLNNPFSRAIINGAESVKAINPNLAVVTSGVSAALTLAAGAESVLEVEVSFEELPEAQP